MRAYLDCGVLAYGFLRVHCDACGHDRLVAFSCKGRGFCPSCGGRRMADTAAHLVDRVLPEVPIRQWVLTLPYPLRYRCAWNARLTSEVLRAFLRAVFADQRRRARKLFGIHKGQCGSVTFIQRFGSALNLTPRFHTLVLDGVYAGPSHSPGDFAALPPPETEDVACVLAGTARRILRRLGDRVEPIAEDDAGVEPQAVVPPRCVRQGGMSLHADVAVPARDRKRLERLCRYVARPPLALGRLEAITDGRLAYRLKTPWRDGTTHVVMERRELLERLAPLIPPPRAHQVRYHGVLAPCSSARDQVVPAGPEALEAAASCDAGVNSTGAASGEGESLGVPPRSDSRTDRSESLRRRAAWSDLLKRVFEVDALRCPACGGRMRLVAAITEPSVASRILACLSLPPRAPPLRRTNEIDLGPGVGCRAFNSTPAEGHGDPGSDFDQSPAEERDSNEDP